MNFAIETLVLGAGPAGMACSMELYKKNKKSILIEKSNRVGGLSKTIEFIEPSGLFKTDIGPHRFFSKNPYLYEFVEDLIGDEWKVVHRHTRFYVDGKYYDYPIKIAQVLTQMGVLRSGFLLRDYLWERFRTIVCPRNITNFKEYVVSNFGTTLAEFNMLNYTRKIWGIPCEEISVDWAEQRIKGLSVLDTIKKSILGYSSTKSLVDTFYYPEHGTGRIYEAILQRIHTSQNEVYTQSTPTVIYTNNSVITEVDIKTETNTRTYTVDNLVSSIPITELVELFSPPAPKQVRLAAKSLRFRSQIYLFLIVDKESITPDNWIYYPDKNIPFGRISEMKNFSTTMCPPGKTSLFIEFFVFENDKLWNMPQSELYELTLRHLEILQLLTKKEVINYHYFSAKNVYPIYDLEYKTHISTIINWCDQFTNLQLIGRPGRFRYTNQDHSLEMGITAAKNIIDGKNRDIGLIGSEQAYYENGNLR